MAIQALAHSAGRMFTDPRVRLSVFANAVSGAFSLVVPLFYSVAIDKVLGHKALQTLYVLIATLVVVSITDFFLSHAFNRFVASRIAADQEDRYQGVIEKYLGIPLNLVHGSTSFRPGLYVGDVDRAVSFPIRDFSAFVSDCLLLAMYGFAMAFISIPLALATGLFVLLHVALIAWNRISEKRLQETRTVAGSQFGTGLTDLVHEFESIRVNHLARTMARRIRDSARDVIEASYLRDLRANDSSDLVNLLNRLNVAVVLWGACMLVIGQQMTVGQLVSFNLLYYRLSTPLGRLVRYGMNAAMDQAAAGRLRKLDELSDPAVLDTRDAAITLDGSIRLNALSFQYRGQESNALTKITAAIEPDTMVAIQGASGSGKTTLMRILARLLPSNGGTILFGTLPIGSIDEVSFRRQVSVVLQTDTLFRASVADNLRLFSNGIGEAEMMDLTRAVGAHDFIMSHPKGYDAIVGDDRDFSLGQRRRLLIVRALLRKPKILLLDEPTAGLDAKAEEHVARLLEAHRRQVTIVVATHSPALIARCDRVLSLQHGQLTAAPMDVAVRPASHHAELARHA